MTAARHKPGPWTKRRNELSAAPARHRADSRSLQEKRWRDRSIQEARQSVEPSGAPTRAPCLELTSRKPSWPAVKCERINRPDIWVQAIRSDTRNTLAGRGPSTYGFPLSQGRHRVCRALALHFKQQQSFAAPRARGFASSRALTKIQRAQGKPGARQCQPGCCIRARICASSSRLLSICARYMPKSLSWRSSSLRRASRAA